MNPQQLQQLWAPAVGDLEQPGLDPTTTYRSPSLVRLREQSISRPKQHQRASFFDEDDDYIDLTVTDVQAEDDYVLIEQIAHGGMGVIYRARQSQLRREIVLKKSHAKPGIQERFLSEAMVTASLSHPNIPPVYDLVTIKDGIALAMKYIDGVSWRALLHPRTPEEQERASSCDLEFHLDVLLKVCDAISYAHAKGYAHNDLKPENIMVGQFGEVFVMDWGLALDVRDEPHPPLDAPHCRTIDGEVFGTPSYMAPELAEGKGTHIGPWTDVYLLGAILYEILMGRPPHRGMSMMEVLLNASASEPKSYNPDTPKQLQLICDKATLRSPSGRYVDVASFQAALRGYLKHRESMLIAEKAASRLRACHEAMGYQLAAYDQTQSHTRVRGALRGDRNELYLGFADAVSGFVQAQLLWEGNEEARHGEVQARLAFSRAALKHGDVGVAEAQMAALSHTSPEAQTLSIELEVFSRERIRERQQQHFQTRALWGGLAVFLLALLIAVGLLFDQRSKAQKQANFARSKLFELHQLADSKRLLDYENEARHLWPALPEKLPQFKRWLSKSKTLVAQLQGHNATLASLRQKGTQLDGKWHFKRRTLQWQHDTLARLVKQLRHFQDHTIPRIQERLRMAQQLTAGATSAHQRAWQEAIQAIANPKTNPIYKGLKLTPQLGLLPIGKDLRSGLWEFAHIQSGTPPTRDKKGTLQRTKGMGIVMVLLPGGTFAMGATRQRKAHYDPNAKPDEAPLRQVGLAPFFLAKYELTQQQWTRFADDNPSALRAGKTLGKHQIDVLHPVENMSWQQASQVVARMDLTLPTEAQWEYAARAGTNTSWYTGNQRTRLMNHANLADRDSLKGNLIGNWRAERWLRDGYVTHAPVGSYRPNPWGLHDMVGNVWEWCLDRYGPYTLPVLSETGQRVTQQKGPWQIRGGSFQTMAIDARSSARHAIFSPSYRSHDLGVRPARSLQLPPK